MEIKVGDYVRTKKGYIGKVIDISNVTGQKRKKYLIKWNIGKVYYITNIKIIKNSSNIIDLIEVGDILKLKDGEKWEVQEHQGVRIYNLGGYNYDI